jgi:hypothetical protein
MPCRHIQTHLDDYLEGTLDFREKERFDEHFGICSECREILKQEKSLLNLLKSSSPPDPGESYWGMLEDLVISRTIIDEKANNLPEISLITKPADLLQRYLIPLAASILLLFGSLTFSGFDKNPILFANQSSDYENYYASYENEGSGDSYIFTAIVSTSPGSLGRHLVFNSGPGGAR